MQRVFRAKRTNLHEKYDYPSKRTNLYFDIGQAKQTNLENNRAYALGVRHTF